MTIVIQHNYALDTTTSKTIYDVNGKDYYIYPGAVDIVFFYAQFCLLIVTSKLWTED